MQCFQVCLKEQLKLMYLYLFASTIIQNWVNFADIVFIYTLSISLNMCEIHVRNDCKSIRKCKGFYFLVLLQ